MLKVFFYYIYEPNTFLSPMHYNQLFHDLYVERRRSLHVVLLTQCVLSDAWTTPAPSTAGTDRLSVCGQVFTGTDRLSVCGQVLVLTVCPFVVRCSHAACGRW